jgi:ribosome-interacting GTPase 1
MIEKEQLPIVKEMCNMDKIIEVAAPLGKGIKELKEQIYHSLDFISIFMKPQGEKADLKEPLVVRKGTTIVEICQHLHRDFKRKFRYSQVWGPSAKFPGQTVGLNHKVKDQDIVSIITHR